MFPLIVDIIVFWILLAVTLVSFWSFWLWANREFHFKSEVSSKLWIIKKNIKIYNNKYKKHVVDFFIDRTVLLEPKQTFTKYQFILLNDRWEKLSEEEFKRVMPVLLWEADLRSFITISYLWTWWTIWDFKNYEKYDKVLLWEKVKNSVIWENLINYLSGKVETYWYVDFIKNSNIDISRILNDIDDWKNKKVNGIFLNNTSYSLLNWTYSYTDYKNYLQYVSNNIKLNWLKIIYYTTNPHQIRTSVNLWTWDVIMTDNFYYLNWKKWRNYWTKKY